MAKAPTFQFYASDFLTDTSAWSAEEVGAYIRLLANQWVNGALPKEKERLARIGGTTVETMVQIWLTIGCKFIERLDGKLINLKLEETRQKKDAFLEKQAQKGRKSAERRKNQLKSNSGCNSGSNLDATKNQPLEDEDEKEEENEIEIEKKQAQENLPLLDFEPHLQAKNPQKASVSTRRARAAPTVTMPFQTAAFQELWGNWKDYRQKEFKKSYKSPQSEQAALSHLVKLADGSEENATAIIMQSMGNTWQGFFPLNETGNGKRLPTPKSTISSSIAAVHAAFLDIQRDLDEGVRQDGEDQGT